MRRALIAAGIAVAGAVVLAAVRSSRAAPGDASSSVQDALEDVMTAFTPGPWEPPARAVPYLGLIRAVESQHGMPANLLARLLYQESRFRPEIIDGTVRSRAGATGIAQFMPDVAAAYGIDPTDPAQAIPAAGQELAKMHRRFGNWEGALAGYNWGQGNWNSFLRTGRGARGQERPQENIDYVAQIGADVGLA